MERYLKRGDKLVCLNCGQYFDAVNVNNSLFLLSNIPDIINN